MRRDEQQNRRRRILLPIYYLDLYILNCEGFRTNRQRKALIVSNDINISIMLLCSGLELHNAYTHSSLLPEKRVLRD